MNKFALILREKLGIIILTGILVGAVSFLFLVLSEKNFKAQTDFLVVQNQASGQDYYTLSKSAEFVGKILGEAIYSESFIDEVEKTGKVPSEFLPFDKRSRLEEWGKIVRVKSNSQQLGIINVEVFGNTQRETIGISEAIAEVLTTKNNLFRGEGQTIEVKILSGPILEKNPTGRDITAVIVGGFIVGALLSFALVYYRREGDINKFYIEKSYRERLERPRTNMPTEILDPDEYEESIKNLTR